MSADSLIFVLVIVLMFAALVSRRVSPVVGVVGTLMALFLLGVIDDDQALQGFSNRAPVTIACLYVVAGAIDRTSALTPIVRSLTGARSAAAGLVRIIAVSAGISSLVANTPVVAMLINPLVSWSGRQRQAPSKVLIPLSYATLFGGMVTLIGTSTNLVGSGVVTSLGGEPFGILEPAKLGLPIALIGLAMVMVLGPRVLPDRGGAIDADVERPFTVNLMVEGDGPLDGATIQSGGLRNLPGVFLVGVERNGELTAPVHPGASVPRRRSADVRRSGRSGRRARTHARPETRRPQAPHGARRWRTCLVRGGGRRVVVAHRLDDQGGRVPRPLPGCGRGVAPIW